VVLVLAFSSVLRGARRLASLLGNKLVDVHSSPLRGEVTLLGTLSILVWSTARTANQKLQKSRCLDDF
jgi:hypothetical protein